jgi:hypothetical protein
VIRLSQDTPIFVGFKLETGLRRQLESIAGPDKKYVSHDDSTFLRICKLGDDHYVGKLIEERLTTERIDDIKRNVVSILNRLCPEERLPKVFVILAVAERQAAEPGELERQPAGEPSGRGYGQV